MPVLLLDTLSLLYRAHHALPPMSTRAGEPTSALLGFFSLFLKLLREQGPEGVAFAIDAPGPTFRREAFEGYKAGRARMPDEVRTQRARLETMIEALGAPLWSVPGFEADDVLATLASELESHHDVLIVSGDRDLFQTVGPRTRVLFVGRRGKDHVLYDEARVQERFGLSPRSLPSLVALTGDASDALPGVPGVGVKTAASWIARYGDVAGLLAHLDEAKPARLREAVRERVEQLRLNEELARLRRDVPLDAGPRFAALDAAALGRLRACFEELELASLTARLDALSR